MGRLPASVSTPHSLADLVELQRGYDLTAAERMPGHIPVIGGGGPNGTHDTANVAGPGVVVVRSGSGFGNVWWVDEDFWAHNTVMFARSFKGNHKKFTYYVLDWLDFTSYNSGGAQPSLNRNFIYAIPVFLPLPPEQERIAGIIETWDRAIETVEALLANARVQKRALMQRLLNGKLRLPGFSGEWQHKTINEIATRVTRRNDGSELPVMTISSTSGFVRQDEKYSRFMAGKSVETYILLNEGEFAYNKGNSKTYEFGCIFDLDGYARALVPHVYVCFKLKKGYSHRFYKALFEADYLAPQLGRLVNTGVRNNGLLNIKPSEFVGTKVPVPPLDEQDAIAAVMEAASRTVIEHETQLTALRQEKAALMQQLLTGKRRVKLPSSEVA